MKNNTTSRSHARADGQVQTSIAADARILDKIAEIAQRERRSRNKQITLFLEQQIATYENTHGEIWAFDRAAESRTKYGAAKPGEG